MYAVKHVHNAISKAIPTTIQSLCVVHHMGQLLDILFTFMNLVKISVLFLARGNGNQSNFCEIFLD